MIDQICSLFSTLTLNRTQSQVILLNGNHGQSRRFYGPGRGVNRAILDQFYRRLVERVYAQDDPEVVFLTTALTNILGHDNRGDPPTEVLLMAAWGRARKFGSSKPACFGLRELHALEKCSGSRTGFGYYKNMPSRRNASPRPRLRRN